MAQGKGNCQKPENLKGGDPKKCSPEQIRKCHGDTKGHPCTQEAGKK